MNHPDAVLRQAAYWRRYVGWMRRLASGLKGGLIRTEVCAPGLAPATDAVRQFRAEGCGARTRMQVAEVIDRVGFHAYAARSLKGIARKASREDPDWWLFAHRLQFFIERAHFRAGSPGAEDPLFEVRVGLCERRPLKYRWFLARSAFDVRVSYRGLRVHGFLSRRTAECDSVHILLDGVIIKSVKVHRGSPSYFEAKFDRGSIARFPPSALLTVETGAGEVVTARGLSRSVRIVTPRPRFERFDVSDLVEFVDKKGAVRNDAIGEEVRQAHYLQLYAEVCEILRQELGKDLMVIYGTLLGHYRDGRLIRGDDDFDACIVASSSSAAGVKVEAIKAIRTLVEAGFTVSINRRGRPFRVHPRGSGIESFHLDIHVCWFERGMLWAPPALCFPADVSAFLPPIAGRLQGVSVLAPRRPDIFLEANYGPGWRVPDPSFRYYLGGTSSAVSTNFAKSFISPSEYRRLLWSIAFESGRESSGGALLAVGELPLYPLVSGSLPESR
jgi:hypothetical protein